MLRMLFRLYPVIGMLYEELPSWERCTRPGIDVVAMALSALPDTLEGLGQ